MFSAPPSALATSSVPVASSSVLAPATSPASALTIESSSDCAGDIHTLSLLQQYRTSSLLLEIVKGSCSCNNITSCDLCSIILRSGSFCSCYSNTFLCVCQASILRSCAWYSFSVRFIIISSYHVRIHDSSRAKVCSCFGLPKFLRLQANSCSHYFPLCYYSHVIVRTLSIFCDLLLVLLPVATLMLSLCLYSWLLPRSLALIKF